jgi:outer membrane protein OmpA-like peptidoglycan-associated protein
MSRRTNPWPAFVDLFSALLVAAFAGFILMTSGFKKPGTGPVGPGGGPKSPIPGEVVSDVRKEADNILRELQKNLAQRKMRTRVSNCGEDTCLDLYIHFTRNFADIVFSEQKAALDETCISLREALDRFPPEQRHDIEIIVEGHTDRTQASGGNPKGNYLYNWELSSKRAASILWEFRSCNLQAPSYSITASGYADSRMLCDEATTECDQKNRRTTLRLRANTQKIDERLGAAKESSGSKK